MSGSGTRHGSSSRGSSHQRRDDYWRNGSACEHYDQIRCPVFAIGGWSDGYRDMVFRVLEHVRSPVRGLIGPWGHRSPEDGKPGPAIGFLQECVRFFAASLDGAENGFFDEPKLISYMQEAVTPAGSYAERAGRWVADPSWPSPSVTEHRLQLGETALVPLDQHADAQAAGTTRDGDSKKRSAACGECSPPAWTEACGAATAAPRTLRSISASTTAPRCAGTPRRSPSAWNCSAARRWSSR